MTQRFLWILTTLCATALLTTPAQANVDGPIVGASATIYVRGFPEHGYAATAEWNEDAQAFTLVTIRTPEDAALDGAAFGLFSLALPPESLAAVQMALDNGASVHARDANVDTFLHLARQATVAQLLLEEGASVDAQNEHGMTPLHKQVIWGRIAIVRLLLEAGADVNVRDERGWTPLAWVADPPWGVSPVSEEMLALLREYGAE